MGVAAADAQSRLQRQRIPPAYLRPCVLHPRERGIRLQHQRDNPQPWGRDKRLSPLYGLTVARYACRIARTDGECGQHQLCDNICHTEVWILGAPRKPRAQSACKLRALYLRQGDSQSWRGVFLPVAQSQLETQQPLLRYHEWKNRTLPDEPQPHPPRTDNDQLPHTESRNGAVLQLILTELGSERQLQAHTAWSVRQRKGDAIVDSCTIHDGTAALRWLCGLQLCRRQERRQDAYGDG